MNHVHSTAYFMNRSDLRFWIRVMLAALFPALVAAGVLFVVSDVQAGRAGREFEQAKLEALQHVEEAERRIAEKWPKRIAMNLRVAVSPADEYRTELRRIRHQALLNDRRFAGTFLRWGTILLVGLGGMLVFTTKSAADLTQPATLP